MILDQNFEAIKNIYSNIQARTSPVASKPQFSKNPHVYLETSTGKIVYPYRSSTKFTMFHIGPDLEGTVILRSRTFRRYETEGAYTDDTRLLGIRVGEIYLFGPNKTTAEVKHLRLKYLPGWHEIECSVSRWTNGAACLSLDETLGHCSCILAVEITETGQYVDD